LYKFSKNISTNLFEKAGLSPKRKARFFGILFPVKDVKGKKGTKSS